MHERGFVSVLGALGLGLCACAGPTEPTPAPTATPQDVLEKLPAPLRERFDSPAGQRELGRALQDKALLVAEARRRGYGDRVDVKDAVQQLEERLMVQALVRDEQRTLAATPAEIEAYYAEHLADFRQPERVAVKRLFVADRGDRTAALDRAKALINRIRAGATLETLVKESDGPERIRGGDYGAVAIDDKDAALAKAAFSLTPGTHSDVVATAGGFSIVWATERFPPRVRPLDEVRGEVANRLQPMLERRAFENTVKRLRAQQGENP